jgi:hypothetical protein
MTCIVHSVHDLRLAHPGRPGQRGTGIPRDSSAMLNFMLNLGHFWESLIPRRSFI